MIITVWNGADKLPTVDGTYLGVCVIFRQLRIKRKGMVSYIAVKTLMYEHGRWYLPIYDTDQQLDQVIFWCELQPILMVPRELPADDILALTKMREEIHEKVRQYNCMLKLVSN